MTTTAPSPVPARVPRWLRFVLVCDRAGSSWYVGTGFFFAPILAVVAPWPEVQAVIWVAVALFGLWLGLLGLAMATGLSVVLRTGADLPESYWRSIIDYPTAESTDRGAARGSGGRRGRPSLR